MGYNMDFDKGNIALWYLGLNTATEGWLSYSLLVMIFIAFFVYYIRLEQNPIKGGILGSLVCALFAALLSFMGAISWEIAIIPLILLLLFLAVKQFV